MAPALHHGEAEAVDVVRAQNLLDFGVEGVAHGDQLLVGDVGHCEKAGDARVGGTVWISFGQIFLDRFFSCTGQRLRWGNRRASYTYVPPDRLAVRVVDRPC